MSERWWFRYAGDPGAPERSVDFPTQADAEAWFAGHWEQVAEAGVRTVTLFHQEVPVYGPMPLDGG